MENMRFKVGDRVRIKSIDWNNENKDSNGNIVFYSKIPRFSWCENIRTVFTKDMVKFCGKVVTIDTVWTVNYSIVEGTYRDYFTDEMIEGLVEEDIIDIDEFQDDDEIIDIIDEYVHRLKGNECQIDLPEGYHFTDENGNVIEAKKSILEKKKKEYPKTYEECCRELNIVVRDFDILYNMLDTTEIIYTNNLDRLLNSFRKLLICRDAYWKLYGEEMGLGKPWEPDYKTPDIDLYVIINIYNRVEKAKYGYGFQHCVLTFPTEEMRDAFYENFKSEIEQCKELL